MLVGGLLLSAHPVRAAAISIEGDAPLKSISVTIDGATLHNVVQELSQRYGFKVQGLSSTETLSINLSGSLWTVLEGVLRNCNYILIRSTVKMSGLERVIVLNCTQRSLPSPSRREDQTSERSQQQLLGDGRPDPLVAPITPKLSLTPVDSPVSRDNHASLNYNLEERDYLIRSIAFEAPQESDAGKAAVAHVILNRKRSGRWGHNVKDIVTQPWQFEPWMNRRGEVERLSRDDPRYRKAARIADAVLAGEIPDPTAGATHFLNPVVVRQRRGGSLPPWAYGKSLVIGSHTFYSPNEDLFGSFPFLAN
jgi:hypothetical protein